MFFKKEATLTTLQDTIEKFDDDLVPNRDFLYHIVKVAVNGFLEFQLQYPEGTPHWSPHGATLRLNNMNAMYPNGIKASFFIQNPNYPVYNIYNPKAYTVTGEFWFWGWKYTIKQLTERPAVLTRVTDYQRGGGGG